jgi:hypothetical protein
MRGRPFGQCSSRRFAPEERFGRPLLQWTRCSAVGCYPVDRQMEDPKTSAAEPSDTKKLAAAMGLTWTHVERCAAAAMDARKSLGDLIGDKRLVPVDASFVVFGSLARGEWTAGSDVDWTLLVDGQADDAHLTITQDIRREIKAAEWKDPGRSGLFGGLAFSHELVHRIGGDEDSNRNITQRILLLLESRAPVADDTVRERVLRVLLNRYLTDDFGHLSAADQGRVPQFLLNDIVRYWRTMTVDFAFKRRDREGKGWLLRNFKLRVSRKLIFAAGLTAALSCLLRPPQALARRESQTEGDYTSIMAGHLLGFANRTPLDCVAWLASEFKARAETVRDVFESYDAFLGILADGEKRARLEVLTPDTMASDPLFAETRSVGSRFQQGLASLFFDTAPELTKAVQKYGVF